MPESKIGRITGTWGGILSGVAAIITAVALSVTDTGEEKAKKADDKSELVLDLVKAQLEFAEKERTQLREELSYQRNLNVRVFAILDELRDDINDIPVSAPLPASTPARLRPLSSHRSSGAAVVEAVEEEGAAEEEPLLSLDDLLFPTATLEEAPVQQQAAALPENLEDLIEKGGSIQ